MKWWTKSANQHNENAKYILTILEKMIESVAGTVETDDDVEYWAIVEKHARAGNLNAMFELGVYLLNQGNPTYALMYWVVACNNGEPRARGVMKLMLTYLRKMLDENM
ncbi:MAG: hypothetical protein LBR45_00295 [Bacteroidales bacterium]|nr:hypothetical protein [Bacteroidales bacterium]